MIQGNMSHLNMFVIALSTSDVSFKHVSCMVVKFMLFHGTHIDFLHFIKFSSITAVVFLYRHKYFS